MLNITSSSEFKAWFDGFSHAINETPSKEQWEIIKKKVEEITVNNSQYVSYPLVVREPCSSLLDQKITCSSLLSDLSHNATPSVF